MFSLSQLSSSLFRSLPSFLLLLLTPSMAGHTQHLLALLLLFSVASPLFPQSFASAAPPLCRRSRPAFLDDLGYQCPRWIELSPPGEVNGETLEKELSSPQKGAYYSVLFYASWCPFTGNTRPIFDDLSSMFPQIKHLTVEESSVMPSLLSRYGIHSFPTIMLINGTTRLRYHGLKDFTSLVHFYKSTGFNPIQFLAIDQPSSRNGRTHVPHVQSGTELITTEPYLTFSILFICLKIIICFFPMIYSRVKALWISHSWHLNLRFLRESNQLLEQVLRVVDVKWSWSNLRLRNKTRNFKIGANNARAWASSLTSVSLGESSSSKVTLNGSQ